MVDTIKQWIGRHRYITAIVVGILVLHGLEVSIAYYEYPQITQTIQAFQSARQRQDLDAAYAQVLPQDAGGRFTRDELQAILNSNAQYLFKLYVRTEVQRSRIRIRLGRTPKGQVVMVAIVEAETHFQTTNTLWSRFLLVKWDGRWWINDIE